MKHKSIKYLVMDVDGTLTDGKFYIGAEGEVLKVFCCKDGYAVHDMLLPRGIIPVIITARESKIVTNRAKEMRVAEVHQGILDKFSKLKEILDRDGNELSSVAYIGDDILDLKVMEPIKLAGGLIGCPSDAVNKVKSIADFVSSKNGGDGAVREFIEWLVG